jgi:hypothetical protein
MIKEQLETQIEIFKTMRLPAIMERFVLRNTVGEMVGVPCTEPTGKPKMCFMNAAHLAFDACLPYVEGYCMSNDIAFPFHHAWCVDGGDIIDPTIKDPTKYRYIGVEIPHDDLRKQLLDNGVYGILDTGMINFRYMFARDPDLKPIVEEITGRVLA